MMNTTVVWVLDFDATLDDEYSGYQSVHATIEGAQDRLWRHIQQLGLLDELQADWNAVADEGCTAADIETGRGVVSYGISRHPRRPMKPAWSSRLLS